MANRVRREITAVGESAASRRADLPSASAADGRVTSSDASWLKPGAPAPWIETLARPGFLVVDERLWLVVPVERPGASAGRGTVRLLDLSDPDSPWLQQLAERTGYVVGAEASEATGENRGITIREAPPEKPDPESPRAARAPARRWPSPGPGAPRR